MRIDIWPNKKYQRDRNDKKKKSQIETELKIKISKIKNSLDEISSRFE